MYVTILLQFKSCLQLANESINSKGFLWLLCLPQDPPAIYSMTRFTLAILGLAFLGFLPICNIIFPIIDQCRYFLTSLTRP